VTSRLYSDRWRERVRAGAQSSAAVLAPRLVDLFHPTTVIDVGAGEGWFADAFEALGATTTRVDGPWVEGVVHVDFSRPPYPDLGAHDLAVCLEVAEHVTPRYADRLVAWLCTLAPTVAFSAAIPGQGGTGHVNEQPPAYWAERFATHGFPGSGALRLELWDDDRIEPWYRQNLLIFGRHDLPLDRCPHLVHPHLWKPK